VKKDGGSNIRVKVSSMMVIGGFVRDKGMVMNGIAKHKARKVVEDDIVHIGNISSHANVSHQPSPKECDFRTESTCRGQGHGHTRREGERGESGGLTAA
jgi:hypothetical protein